MYAGFILASLALGGSQGLQAVEPTYEFKHFKELSIAAAKEKNRTVFVVTNSFGIGGATIKPKAGQWPANISLRFQYSNEKRGGFTSLEHIRMTTDRIYTEGSRSLSGRFAFFFLDAKRQKPFEVIDDRRSAGVLKVLVEERDGALEVTLPPNLLAGSTQIDLYWIDAHRK